MTTLLLGAWSPDGRYWIELRPKDGEQIGEEARESFNRAVRAFSASDKVHKPAR